MIALMFFIVKILIGKVLLQPQKINMQINDIQKQNFKIIGSIITYLTVDCLDKLFSTANPPSKLPELEPQYLVQRATFTNIFFEPQTQANYLTPMHPQRTK